MSKKRRHIRLTYLNTPVSVVAEMLDDEAPTICQHIWDLLPLEKQTFHGLYSGREVFMLLENPKPMPPENLCQLPLPGELLFFYDNMDNVAYGEVPISEIVLVYNRGVWLKGAEGVPTHCSLFARIPGDWKYEWNDLKDVCRKSRLDKPPVLRIERVEA